MPTIVNKVGQSKDLPEFRLTLMRKQIMDIFSDNDAYLSVEDIQKSLKSTGEVVNLKTIYNNLHFLTELKILVSIVDSDGVSRFTLFGVDKHQFTCTKCSAIYALDASMCFKSCSVRSFDIPRHTITNYKVQFFGICGECQKLTKKK